MTEARQKPLYRFQSTLPTRGSDTDEAFAALAVGLFQSTLPTRGSDALLSPLRGYVVISIHAPHEGERPSISQYGITYRYFNPRSPRGGATSCRYRRPYRGIISIHAPHEGERHHSTSKISLKSTIFQSTLPTRGSDFLSAQKGVNKFHFNPRSPRGGATKGKQYAENTEYISIHAPHEGERPLSRACLICAYPYFNPRSPRGGATWRFARRQAMRIFQSTLPTRGSDVIIPQKQSRRRKISIHAPHEGERPTATGRCAANGDVFQSTLPTRGSDANTVQWRVRAKEFQSTLPTRGSDSEKVHLYAAFPRIC